MLVFDTLFKRKKGSTKKMENIDSKTLKMLLKQEEILLVDVREEHEYAKAYIEGTILIPLSSFHASKVPPSVGKKIVFYCRSGIRSQTACRVYLESNTGETVYNLVGGINDWIKEGYDYLSLE